MPRGPSVTWPPGLSGCRRWPGQDGPQGVTSEPSPGCAVQSPLKAQEVEAGPPDTHAHTSRAESVWGGLLRRKPPSLAGRGAPWRKGAGPRPLGRPSLEPCKGQSWAPSGPARRILLSERRGAQSWQGKLRGALPLLWGGSSLLSSPLACCLCSASPSAGAAPQAAVLWPVKRPPPSGDRPVGLLHRCFFLYLSAWVVLRRCLRSPAFSPALPLPPCTADRSKG